MFQSTFFGKLFEEKKCKEKQSSKQFQRYNIPLLRIHTTILILQIIKDVSFFYFFFWVWCRHPLKSTTLRYDFAFDYDSPRAGAIFLSRARKCTELLTLCTSFATINDGSDVRDSVGDDPLRYFVLKPLEVMGWLGSYEVNQKFNEMWDTLTTYV